MKSKDVAKSRMKEDIMSRKTRELQSSSIELSPYEVIMLAEVSKVDITQYDRPILEKSKRRSKRSLSKHWGS
jgi:hypothetical protein